MLLSSSRPLFSRIGPVLTGLPPLVQLTLKRDSIECARVTPAGSQSRLAVAPGRRQKIPVAPIEEQRLTSRFSCIGFRRILPRVAPGIGGSLAQLQRHTRTHWCGSRGALGDPVAINLCDPVHLPFKTSSPLISVLT